MFDRGFVGGTLENRGRIAYILKQGPFLNMKGHVPVVPLAGVVEIAFNPAWPSIDITERRHQEPFIVIGIKLPRKHQCPEVVHTGNALCFGFGLPQSRKKHACEDGDDGDHHKELNKGESISIGPIG